MGILLSTYENYTTSISIWCSLFCLNSLISSHWCRWLCWRIILLWHIYGLWVHCDSHLWPCIMTIFIWYNSFHRQSYISVVSGNRCIGEYLCASIESSENIPFQFSLFILITDLFNIVFNFFWISAAKCTIWIFVTWKSKTHTIFVPTEMEIRELVHQQKIYLSRLNSVWV